MLLGLIVSDRIMVEEDIVKTGFQENKGQGITMTIVIVIAGIHLGITMTIVIVIVIAGIHLEG